MSKKSNRFFPEVRERAVRMVEEHGGEYASGDLSLSRSHENATGQECYETVYSSSCFKVI